MMTRLAITLAKSKPKRASIQLHGRAISSVWKAKATQTKNTIHDRRRKKGGTKASSWPRRFGIADWMLGEPQTALRRKVQPADDIGMVAARVSRIDGS